MNYTADGKAIVSSMTVADLWRSRDKYGRSTWQNYAIRGVVVSMPRGYREMKPGENFLVNLHDAWTGGRDGHSTIAYFAKAKDAKEFLLAHGAPRSEIVEATR